MFLKRQPLLLAYNYNRDWMNVGFPQAIGTLFQFFEQIKDDNKPASIGTFKQNVFSNQSSLMTTDQAWAGV